MEGLIRRIKYFASKYENKSLQKILIALNIQKKPYIQENSN